MTGTPADPGAGALVVGLTRDIVRLPPGGALTIAEFSMRRVTLWTVQPDSIGIPRVRYTWHDWPALRTWGALNDGELLDRLRPEDDARIVLARTDPPGPPDLREPAELNAGDADHAFQLARDKYPQARVFRAAVSVDELLDKATARVPLPPSLWYELVLLRRGRSGRLGLTLQQLFLPEAARGDTRQFTVRCEESDDGGTAFAVVARDTGQSVTLVSVAAAQVPPGTYDITATLLRPGQVRFDGLPVRLREDSRSWLDIQAAVPGSLDMMPPVHLIVAVQICGTLAEIRARTDRASQLIGTVHESADGPVAVSLLTYASHSHHRRTPDEPVTVLAHAATSTVELRRAQRELSERAPAVSLYSRAAQLECMLAAVTRLLRAPESAGAGRPVLVTIGDLPPFPYRVDPLTGIIPCPRRLDWRVLLRELADEHAGMAFGAIRDVPGESSRSPLEEIWRHLGAGASVGLATFDARRFAVSLGLLSAARQYLPLPLAVSEGAD